MPTLIGLYAGTFDPPSLGHLDIIQRAASLCSKLYIAIGTNTAKTSPLFSTDERITMLKLITRSLPQVEVVVCEGLAIDFAKQKKVDCLIRGLRGSSDYEFEYEMSTANRKSGQIETLFLMADPARLHIRASLIRELAQYGHSLLDYIPKEIEPLVREQLFAYKKLK
jgi:pantetheine-phosphate adenylyltransferase